MIFRLLETNELEKRARKHRKKQKGLSPFYSPDGGNVPQAIDRFNNSTAENANGLMEAKRRKLRASDLADYKYKFQIIQYHWMVSEDCKRHNILRAYIRTKKQGRYGSGNYWFLCKSVDDYNGFVQDAKKSISPRDILNLLEFDIYDCYSIEIDNGTDQFDKVDLNESTSDNMISFIVKVINYLQDIGFEIPNNWLAYSWQGLKDGIKMGIDDKLEVSENLRDFIKSIIDNTSPEQINSEFPKLIDFYKELKRLTGSQLSEALIDSDKERFKSDFYNTLSKFYMKWYRRGIEPSPEDLDEAYEWFAIHFFESDDFNESLKKEQTQKVMKESEAAGTTLNKLKKDKQLVSSGNDYVTADGRTLIRGYYGPRGTTIWVCPEKDKYYKTLLDAYEDRYGNKINAKCDYHKVIKEKKSR